VEVFLIRHAEAVDETLALPDPYRHLTAHGRAQATSLGDRLRWHDCAPTHVWTSPLVRAVQTAELVVAGIALAADKAVAIEAIAELAPGAAARAVMTALRGLAGDASALVVGHEPGLSALASLFVGAEIAPLAKAEAVRIIDDRLRWRFAWDADAPTPA
jgi:phosphohistidine phosphatase